MTVYYNEIDPFAAQWLRNLIAKDLIAPGDVDERDIRDVKPDDLRGYDQCHFFAGIGVWSYALRRAGWPDSRNVWTGSCPCQPFSAAGKGGGFDDERHLWPAFFHLIEQCRPDIVLGEQVASKDGLAWFDLVQSDLEGTDYSVGAVDSCSAGFGAPHIRQRLYWMAYADRERRIGERLLLRPEEAGWFSSDVLETARRSGTSELAHHHHHPRLEGRRQSERERAVECAARPGSVAGELADADGGDAGAKGLQRSGQYGLVAQDAGAGDGCARPGPTNGFWRDADWLLCRDGKWRPVEPGTFPLAHGAPARVGRLRAYGNAINAEQATAFCEAARDYLEPGRRSAGLNVDN